MISALPVLPSAACAVPGVSDLCGSLGNLGTSILSAGAGDVLGALAAGVAQGASWLLGQIGTVITATTTIDLGAPWFRDHYGVMLALAAVVLLPLLLLSTVQAVMHQDPARLLRSALVHLPLALLLGAVAIQLVQLGLAATDAMSSAVSSAASDNIGTALSSLASSLASQAGGGTPGVPVFVTLLGALLVSVGALALWVELLVRAAAVYVAALFFPLALASLVWPAISHWCRRLVETIAALALSKFVIVAVLSLALGALGSADGSMASELAGAALLLLAAFAPFALLRLVPLAESGAVHQLEGIRHRVQQQALAAPRAALGFALAHRAPEPLPELGSPGESAGGADPPGAEVTVNAHAPTDVQAGLAGTGVPLWRGSPVPPMMGSPRGTRPVGDTAPIWGGAVEKGDPAGESRDHHVLGRDDLGPVLRWRPRDQPAGRVASGDE